VVKAQMGWDTVDELLCKFYNWKVVTDTFKVKLTYTGQITTNSVTASTEAFTSMGLRL
jgi:hypothetical protein